MATAESIQNLLSAFDQLSPEEKLVVAKEIGRRIATTAELSRGNLEEELAFLADQTFQMYDREEVQDGPDGSQAW